MANQPIADNVDEYIAGFPPSTQKALEELRRLIRATAPNAKERISYAIPVFDVNGHYVVYLAGWKKHVSVYPITPGLEDAFAEELKPYRRGKGTLQFPLGQPMPLDLVRRIVEFRVGEVATLPARKSRHS